MRLSAAAIALLLLASPANAQIAQKKPVTRGSVTPEVIGQRLEDTAERTRAGLPEMVKADAR